MVTLSNQGAPIPQIMKEILDDIQFYTVKTTTTRHDHVYNNTSTSTDGRMSWRSGTSTTLPGWRCHTGGSWSIPTIHPCLHRDHRTHSTRLTSRAEIANFVAEVSSSQSQVVSCGQFALCVGSPPAGHPLSSATLSLSLCVKHVILAFDSESSRCVTVRNTSLCLHL